MLFYGPPGTGKTSTILALTKQLYGPSLYKQRVLELNASDERGISIVREKVKNFARLAVSKPSKSDLEKYPCPPYKIIILDEADSMTNDAQAALRRTMETYSGITRFCLICNYITRIIDPLASRCSKFRFKLLDNDDALGRLKFVANTENIKFQQGSLEKILEISQGDLRKAITFLQTATKLHTIVRDNDGDTEVDGVEGITVASVEGIAGILPDIRLNGITETLKKHDLKDVINLSKDLFAEGWSAAQILDQLHDSLILDDSISARQKIDIGLALNVADNRLSNGTDEQIQLLNLMVKLSKIL